MVTIASAVRITRAAVTDMDTADWLMFSYRFSRLA